MYMYMELLCVEGEPGNKAMLERVHVVACGTCTYVRDQSKTRTVLKPSDGFEAGQTALKPARRFYNFSLAPPTALKPSRRMSSSRGRFKSCA